MKNNSKSLGWEFLIFFSIGVLYLISCLDVINIKIDDVYITLRYARNFISGNGLVFNIGERVESFSNPTWLFLVSGFAKILGITGHFPMIYLAKALCLFLGFCTLVVFFAIMKYRNNPKNVIYCFLFLIAINPFLNVYNMAGLENSLVNLLLALVVLFYLKLQNSNKIIYAGIFSVALGLLSISRPEGIIYPVSILAGIFLFEKISRGKVSRNTYISIFLTFLIFFGYLIFRWIYYHDIFPNTLYAKNNPTFSAFKEGIRYTIRFLALAIAPFALLAFIKSRANDIFQLSYLPLYFVIIAQVAFVIYAGGDWMPGFRLLLPILPIIFFLILDQLNIKDFSKIKAFLLYLVFFIVAGSSFMIGRDWIKQYNQAYNSGLKLKFDIYPKSYYDIAQKLSKLAGPCDLVLVGEAGFVPYFNDQIKFTDVYGILDRHIAKDIKGHHFKRIDNNYFFSLNFTYFVVFGNENLGLNQNGHNYYTGYFQIDLLLKDPRLLENYLPIYRNQYGVIFKKIRPLE